jgi:superfamily II DNA or RNA helicase
MIEVTIDSRLRVRKRDLPVGHEAQIKQRLTVANGAKAAARKRQQWGWQDLPDSFALYEDDGPVLVLPRGFAAELRAGLESSGHKLRWDDQTAAPSLRLDQLVHDGPTLRPDQEEACRDLLLHRQGVVQAATGCLSGDTIININRAGKGFRARIEQAYRKANGVGATQGPPWNSGIETFVARAEGDVSRLGGVRRIWSSGVKKTYVITTCSGRTIRATEEHPFLVDGESWAQLGELRTGNKLRVNAGRSHREQAPKRRYRYVATRFHPYQTNGREGEFKVPLHRAIIEAEINGLPYSDFIEILRRDSITAAGLHYLGQEWHVHHVDNNSLNNDRSNLQLMTATEHLQLHAIEGGSNNVLWQIGSEVIQSVKEYGEEPTYDVSMVDEPHNFLANGFVVHNSGKTVLVLEAWRRTGLRGLILVEKAALATQWRERASQHLDVEAGLVGEGEWDERDLTIAMLQTLRRREIGDDWFRRWGFTALDEAHHARADTYQEILRRVVSRYVVGVTATPLEGMWEQPFLTRTIGPIFHISGARELSRQGVLVTPTVRRVHTGWRWVPESPREERLVDTKTIYRYVIKQLEGSLSRVDTIAKTIMVQPPQCAQLVVSKRLGYLDRIRTALEFGGYEGQIYDYRGSVSSEDRSAVARAADAGGCVILATVADEGVDIPRLDRLHLVWPQRQDLTITQQVGRVLRSHPDKRETVVFDYVDEEGVLASQATSRMRLYRRLGYSIESAQRAQEATT